VDAELQVLGERLVELLVVVLVLRDLVEHLQALLHDVLPDHLLQSHRRNGQHRHFLCQMYHASEDWLQHEVAAELHATSEARISSEHVSASRSYHMTQAYAHATARAQQNVSVCRASKT